MAPTFFDEPVSFRCPILGISTTIDTAEDALAHVYGWPPASGPMGEERRNGTLEARAAIENGWLGENPRMAFTRIATAYGCLQPD